jgi:hypothetical protein
MAFKITGVVKETNNEATPQFDFSQSNADNNENNYGLTSEVDTDQYIPPQIQSMGSTVADDLRNAYLTTNKVNPSQAIEDVKLSNYMDVPVDYFLTDDDIRKKVADAAQEKKIYEADWDNTALQFPVLSSFLSDPKNMATAKDVLPELAEQEQYFKSIYKPVYIPNTTIGPRNPNEGATIGPAFKYQGTTIASKQPSWMETVKQMAYSGVAQFNQGMIFTPPRMLSEAILGKDNSMVKWLTSLSQGAQEVINTAEEKSKAMKGIKKLAYTGGSAAVNMLPTMAMTALTGGASEVPTIGVQSSLLLNSLKNMLPFGTAAAGQYAEQARQEGATLSQQAAYGLYGGSVEMVTELPFVRDYVAMTGSKEIVKSGIKNILKEFGKSGLDFIKNTAEESVGEVISSPLTQAAKKSIYQPDTPLFGENGIISVPQAEADAYGAFAMTTVMHAMGLPFSARAHQMAKAIIETGKTPNNNQVVKLNNLVQIETPHNETKAKINEAKDNTEVYKKTGELVAKSQYLDRLPESWRTLAEDHLKEGQLENIYIDTEPMVTLLQSMTPEGVNPGEVVNQVAEELGISDQLQEAIKTNKPVKIPYATWLEKTAKTSIYNKLEKDIKFSEEGFTLGQAALQDEDIKGKMTAEQKKADQQIVWRDSLAQGYDAIFNDMKEKLLQAGKPANVKEREFKALVEHDAQIYASHAVTESVRQKINPLEWYMGQNNPEIRAGAFFKYNVENNKSKEKTAKRTQDYVPENTEILEVTQDQRIRLEKAADYKNDERSANASHIIDGNGKHYILIDKSLSSVEKSKHIIHELRHAGIHERVKAGENGLQNAKEIVEYVEQNPNQDRTLTQLINIYKKVGYTNEEIAEELIAEGNLSFTNSASDLTKLRNGDASLGLRAIENRKNLYSAAQSYNQEQVPLPSEAPIITVRGNVFGEDMKLDELQKQALNYAKQNFQGKSIINNHTGWEVGFSKTGLSKTMSHAALREHNISMAVLDKLMENAVYLRTEEDHKGRNDIKAWHYFYAPLKIDNKTYLARLAVRETTLGQKFYDHMVVETEWPTGKLLGRDQIAVTQHQADGESTVSISNLVDLVNRRREVDPLFQSENQAPPFYSKLQNVIESQKQNTFTSEQLKGMFAKSGVKEDELKWTGVETWLADKKKVSKQEVLDYLKTDGQVKVEVVENADVVTPKDEEIRTVNEKMDKLLEQQNNLFSQIVDVLKEVGGYDQENAQAIVEGLPAMDKNSWDIVNAIPEFEERGINLNDVHDINEELATAEYETERLNQPDTEVNTKYSHYTVPGGKNYKEILLTLPSKYRRYMESMYEKYGDNWVDDMTPEEIKTKDRFDEMDSPYYKSSHWDEPNVLAHIRTTERTDSEGNKILFIEELQSDWGQQAKKYGIYNEETKNGMVPDAPFISSTDKWLNLSLKHIIRFAAENGIDKIAWATGEQNAGHYDLSKQISSIRYEWLNDTFVEYTLFDKKDNRISNQQIEKSELENVFGKEIANKIINGDKSGELSELDLKVGGEGMKAFYDKIVPQTVSKFVRQFDKGINLENVDVGHGEQMGFTISDKLKETALNEGFSLFQGERGFIQFGQESSLITMLKSADASTFVHEASHLFLNDSFNFVRSGQADEEYMDYWTKIVKHLDIKEGQESLTVDQQEQWAREFEAYLMEGKAPSEGLRKAFAAFRRWLVRIYRDIAGLNVELSDEVRGIMDRMLATEDEIREREAANGYLSDVIKEGDVSPATYKKLKSLKEKAHEMAIEALLKPQMAELKPEHEEFLANERERMQPIVAEEVAKMPVYQVMEAVKKTFGMQKDVKTLASRYLKNDGITDEGIAKWEIIAEAFGYTSGNHLARVIQSAPLFSDEVASGIETHMAQYSDLRDSTEIKYEAEKAVHNDSQLDALALEKSILLDLVNKEEQNQNKKQWNRERARVAAQAARKYAKATLADKPYREAMAATSYFAAEREAAVKEANVYAKGDYEAAGKYAEQRMLNHALALEALRVKGFAEKWVKFLETTQKKKKDSFKKDVHFAQVASLLERFGLARKDYDPETKKETLAEWVKRMDDITNTVDIADWLQDETIKKDYKNLTINQIQDVVNAIRNIQAIANMEDRTLVAWDKADFKEIAVKLKTVADENLKEKPKTKLSLKDSNYEKLLKNKDAAKFALLNVETILRKLDGYQSMGTWWKTFYEMFDKAASDESARMDKAVEKYRDILSAYSDKERDQMENRKIYLPEIGESLTKNEILAIALNWGNDANKERLLGGRQWDEETIKGMLEKNLDKRDWQFTQNVWDFINGFWPDIAKLHEELAGFAPEKVQGNPFEVTLPDGSVMAIEGGYYPLKRDYQVDVREAREHNADNPLYKDGSPIWKASTKQGHTKERAESATYPVLLDLNIIQRHVSDVIHDLSYRKAVIDANRMMNNKDIQSVVRDNLGMNGFITLENWTKAAAGQVPQPTLKVMESMARWVRQHTVIFALGGRIGTMFQNMANFSSAVDVMEGFGWGNVAHAAIVHGIHDYYGQVIFNPKHAAEIETFAFDKSQFMKDRHNTFDRDIADMTKRMFNKDNKLQRFAMAGYGFFDKLVNVPLWMEAYKLEINKSGDEEKAIQYADALVRRTAGSGRVIDMPEIMRGSEITKLFTMFYSFMNTQLNLSYEAMDQFKKGGDIPKFLGRLMALWILPATVGTLMAFKGPGDDDDKPTWWLKQLLTYPMQMLPVARDIGNLIVDKALGLKSFGYRATPATGIVESFGNLAGTLHSAAEGNKGVDTVLESGSKIAGYITPYPDMFNNWFWNAWDYMNGMEPKMGDILKRRAASER